MIDVLILAAALGLPSSATADGSHDEAVVARVEIVDTAQGNPCSHTEDLRGDPTLVEHSWRSENGTVQGTLTAQQGVSPGTYIFRLAARCQPAMAGVNDSWEISSAPSGIATAGDRRMVFAADRLDGSGRVEAFITLGSTGD